jgi:hypothetical protein
MAYQRVVEVKPRLQLSKVCHPKKNKKSAFCGELQFSRVGRGTGSRRRLRMRCPSVVVEFQKKILALPEPGFLSARTPR